MIRHQRATNGIADQGGDADDREHTACSYANLADVGDLGDERGREGDEGAAAEAVEGREEDVGHVAAGGEPEGEDEDGAEEGGNDHDVEAAGFVGNVARDGAAEDGYCKFKGLDSSG